MINTHEFRPEYSERSPRRSTVEVLSLVGILVVYAVAALALISQGTPFGHDEAVYSLRARHLVQDAPPVFYWVAYRAPGLPFVLQVAWFGPTTEPFLRLIAAAFGVPLILSTWFIGRTLLGVRVGLIAAAGIALTPAVLGAVTQVWPDVPGAAIGMLAVAVYTWAVARENVSRWVLLVPVLVFAATMIRFGAPTPTAIALAGITLWAWRSALSSWKLITVTAALTFVAAASVLLVPAVTGWAQLGEPISPYTAIAASQSSGTSLWIQTITDYWGVRSHLLGGLVGGAMVVGVASGIVVAVKDKGPRTAFWTVIWIAGITLAALSWLLHAESRYLAPVFPWMWIAAGVGLSALVPRVDRKILIPALAILAMALVADSYDRSGLQNDFNASQYQRIKDAARLIDDDAPDEACSVLSSYVGQVGWYSKCPTRRIEVDTVVVDSPWFPEGPGYLYLVEGGKRQPEDEILDGYMAVSTGPAFTVGDPEEGNRQYVEVYYVDQ